MSTLHFADYELRCQCGCEGLPPQEFQSWLEQVRLLYGGPMVLSSAYRCPDHNDAVSSTGRTGPHTIGAADVKVSGAKAKALLMAACDAGATGLGVSQKGPHAARFIHIDRLEGDSRPWIWSY